MSRELLGELIEALETSARDAHQMHQMFSGGKLHPGDFETCPSMRCEDVRDLLTRAHNDGRVAE